jgi:hypothetical protein
MATHGDRKLSKAAVFTSFEPAPFQHLFDQYVELTNEHPETRGSHLILELFPFEKITSVPTFATAFANRGKWYNINCLMRWQGKHLDERVGSSLYLNITIFRASQHDFRSAVGLLSRLNIFMPKNEGGVLLTSLEEMQ